jgi:uncharacterized protein YjdB/protein tyrosine/serine phosphatase
MKKSIYNLLIIILLGTIIGILVYILFFNNEKNKITNLKLDKSIINLYIGEKEKLDVTVTPDELSNEIVWESNDNNIASVTENGEVLANDIGGAIITVRSKDDLVNDTCLIYVTKKENIVVFDKNSISLEAGKKDKLTVIINNEVVDNNELTWESSNSNVVTVNNGEILAKDFGYATVTATTINGEKTTCAIRVVTPAKIPVNNITLNKKDIIMVTGAKEILEVTISPDNATDKRVLYSSSNSKVATVENGTIIAKSEGTATITVIVDGKKEICNVKVYGIKTFNLQNEVMNEYLKDTSNVKKIFTKYKCNNTKCNISNNYESNLTGDINLYIYNKNDNTKKLVAKTNVENINYHILPNTIYYIESAVDTTKVEVVKVEGNLRLLRGLGNFRDLGGWAADGGIIKHGLLFRSANTNSLTSMNVLNSIGINRVVDLRPDGEINSSSAVESIRVRSKLINYSSNKDSRDAVEKVMKAIVDDKHVLFNCNFGRDRTGTIAYLIEGILGVSLEDRKTDFELTYFFSTTRTRNDGSLGNLIRKIDKFDKTTYEQEKFINWYLSFSSDKNKDLELINNFRKKMINGNPHQYGLSNNKLVIK